MMRDVRSDGMLLYMGGKSVLSMEVPIKALVKVSKKMTLV